jgi:hypothetical protein
LLGKAYGPGAGKLIRSSDPRSVDQEG